LFQQFLKDHQDDKSTPYKTKEQYKKRIQECRHYGKLVKFTSEEDPHGEKFEYHQHPFNAFMYSCLDKSKEVLTLLTRSQTQGTEIWKRNLHEELHQNYITKAYKAILDGGLQELRGEHPAESNQAGLRSVVFKLFQMSGEHGKEVSKFWGSDNQEKLFATWKAEKERVKAAEEAEKRRVKVAEKAERKRLKEEEKAAAKKRHKIQPQQATQFSSPVINNHSGSTNFIFQGPVSAEALKSLASLAMSHKPEDATLIKLCEVAEKAEGKRLKEEETAAAKKRHKTEQQQATQFSSLVINNNSGSTNFIFRGPASAEALKSWASPATSDK